MCGKAARLSPPPPPPRAACENNGKVPKVVEPTPTVVLMVFSRAGAGVGEGGIALLWCVLYFVVEWDPCATFSGANN